MHLQNGRCLDAPDVSTEITNGLILLTNSCYLFQDLHTGSYISKTVVLHNGRVSQKWESGHKITSIYFNTVRVKRCFRFEKEKKNMIKERSKKDKCNYRPTFVVCHVAKIIKNEVQVQLDVTHVHMDFLSFLVFCLPHLCMGVPPKKIAGTKKCRLDHVWRVLWD